MKEILRLPTNLKPGPLAWMARNSVAANLLMIMLIVGGLSMAGSIKKEVVPELELDLITVSVVYPGASPQEVEEGIVLAIEEAVRGVDDIKTINASASEGRAVITAELLLGADNDRALSDIKSAVDRITSFPADAERPVISLATNRQQVLSLIVHGDLDQRALRNLAEDVRADLLDDPEISLVEISGLPQPEISIEVSQQMLRTYNLTLSQIAAAVAGASVDVPGGAIRTEAGDVLVRTKERRNAGSEFRDIVVVARADGTRVTLGDIATIRDGFAETDIKSFYNGRNAARVDVFRIGDESPSTVAAAVDRYVQERSATLPAGIGFTITDDASLLYEGRVGLLLDNGKLGAFLVLIVLGIFLQPRLAFWVTLGIPISFLGAMFFIPALGVSINMISMFAFILTLGIVVDDAVVVGEATFKHRREGLDPMDAAIAGVREVRMPVTFAVLTTMLAFVPLLFVPGIMGKFFTNIPLIVLPILVLSLIESLLILPAHLAHIPLDKEITHWRITRRFFAWQRRFSVGLEGLIENRLEPLIRSAVHVRYTVLAAAVGLLIACIGVVAGGHVPFVFFPDVEADQVVATIELPFGSPAARSEEAMNAMLQAAREIAKDADSARADDAGSILAGLYSGIGRSGGARTGLTAGASSDGGHLSTVTAILAPAAERKMSASQFAQHWREYAAQIPGAERVAFNYSLTSDSGAAFAIELSHRDRRVLEDAATDLADALAAFAGVYDIDNGFRVGKTQLDLTIKEAAQNLGLDERDLALQVRSAFYGAEAKRQQRDRDELKVFVRLPRAERESMHALENLMLRTPGGGELPLGQAAHLKTGRSFTSINRSDGRRVVEVTADLNDEVTTAGQLVRSVQTEVLPQLLERYPGLSYSLSGEQESQQESVAAMMRGMGLALIAMYALIAVAFRSYLQPLAVLMVIPFGFIGALIGHALLGFSLSLISIMGLIALAGVVVNDSLVLVTSVNDYRRAGMGVVNAVVAGTTRRVRPVLLTSLTTFFGLAPMIFETSLQARFLVPMAISLGFGVLFVTVIALLLVPAVYLVLEDLKRWLSQDDKVRETTEFTTP